MADCVEMPKFPGYFIYEDGRVYSEKSGEYMKPQPVPNKDAVYVQFRNSNGEEGLRKKSFLVHRLVYGCFLMEEVLWNQSILVAHKNGDKKDNRLENLEISTYSQLTKKKIKESNRHEKFEKKVRQYDLRGNFIQEFNSIKEASEITKQPYHSISKVCLGKQKTTGNQYTWEFSENGKQVSDEKLKEITESWRPVPQYPSHLISKYGEIYYVKTKTLLEPLNKDNKDIYIRAAINFRGEKKSECVHRLVAETYIPNPENKPEVNHKDGNKHNNNLSNLEWVTKQENSQHACDTGLCPKPKGKAVIQLDSNTGEEIKRFEFLQEAGKAVGLKSGDTIKLVCDGKRKTAGGYKWKLVE